MDEWRKFYEDVLGFTTFVRFDETDISTQYSSLKSIVLRSKNWKVKLPINEPAKGIKKSQIEEYLDFNEGPGVQHIAIQTNDIIKSITALRKNGVDFLVVPDSYYDDLKKRVGNIDEDIKKLKELNILVDRDEEGYLLQLFTKPVEDRPTLFIEIIQRIGSRGFGQGNFQALFELYNIIKNDVKCINIKAELVNRLESIEKIDKEHAIIIRRGIDIVNTSLATPVT